MSAEKMDTLHWVFHCDCCSEYLDTDDLDDLVKNFGEAFAHAQSAGWVAFQTGKKMQDGSPEWGHMCPSCAED